jgi:hypothetical protein
MLQEFRSLKPFQQGLAQEKAHAIVAGAQLLQGEMHAQYSRA